jgi:hypothetical protein
MKRPTAGAPHSALSISTTAQSLGQLGLTLNASTTHVLLMADTTNVRFTLNGTTPTATIGLTLSTTAPEPLELTRAQAEAARFIVAAGTATLQVAELADI